MSLAEDIANALGGAKKTPKGYVCRCPCHADKEASLSLTEEHGEIIVNCFSGCEWKVIKEKLAEMNLLPRKKNSLVRHDFTHNKQSDRYAGAKFYIYRDIVGNILCRKVKLPDKRMWFERLDSGDTWRAGLSGMVVPLYNLAVVLSADIVYLCEGEKDAETLIAAGLCATTNHAGAKSWAKHLTEQLKNKTVIIIPDNDDAGRKRVAIISKALQGTVKEIRVFVPDKVPEHGDITDWVQAGGDPRTILAASVTVEKRKENKKAPREDYYELFETVWHGPRRCMFSRKLMQWDETEKIWNPCINTIELVKSEALVLNESRESKFVMSAIETHFFAFEVSKECELLVDIPEWDGEERIFEMASLIKLKDTFPLDSLAWADLLKEWCALVFQRLNDPHIQNRILILQGAQGIGKDTWTNMLVDGLGQFCVPLNVVGNDKDTFLTLHDGLVMKISEFDKTSKTEVSTLKDMITTPKTMLRGAYERDRRLRLARCSFISSANVEDLLRDHTGSRRYLIIEIESITYGYAGWSREKIHDWQMQCLAEMKHLALEEYKASDVSWNQMRDYLDNKTPTDMAADAIELFAQRFRKDNIGYARNEPINISPNDERAVLIISSIAKDMGIKPRTVKSMIGAKLSKRKSIGGTAQPRFWQVPALPGEEGSTPPLPQEPQTNMHW